MNMKKTITAVGGAVVAGTCMMCGCASAPHISGDIPQAMRYADRNPRFAKAFAFLQRKDLSTLPIGRYEIDGDKCYAMVQEATLKPIPAGDAKFEAHRKYIDIQSPITDEETMGVMKTPESVLAGEFNVKDDYVLFDAKGDMITLKPGQFAIFFPPDGAHAPCLTKGEAHKIRKVVIKVLAD